MKNLTIQDLIDMYEIEEGLQVESEELIMEVHPSEYYLGGEKGGYTTDDNRYFSSLESAIQYIVNSMGGLEKIIRYEEA